MRVSVCLLILCLQASSLRQLTQIQLHFGPLNSSWFSGSGRVCARLRQGIGFDGERTREIELLKFVFASACVRARSVCGKRARIWTLGLVPDAQGASIQSFTIGRALERKFASNQPEQLVRIACELWGEAAAVTTR